MPEPLELLVLAQPRGGQPAGTVVEVRRSPAVWGACESIREWVRQGFAPQDYPGHLRVVKTSALTWDEAMRLLEPDIQITNVPSLENPDVLQPEPMTVRVRKSFIDVDKLPPDVKADFDVDDGRDAIPPNRRAAFLSLIKEVGNPRKGVDITKEIPKTPLPRV